MVVFRVAHISRMISLRDFLYIRQLRVVPLGRRYLFQLVDSSLFFFLLVLHLLEFLEGDRLDPLLPTLRLKLLFY